MSILSVTSQAFYNTYASGSTFAQAAKAAATLPKSRTSFTEEEKTFLKS